MSFLIDNILKKPFNAGEAQRPTDDSRLLRKSLIKTEALKFLPQATVGEKWPVYGFYESQKWNYLAESSYYHNLVSTNRDYFLQMHQYYPPFYQDTQFPPYNSPSKRKGGQIRFSDQQTEVLEKRFNSNKYLSPEERKIMAEMLGLSDRQVKTWFQNRRAKWRRNSVDSDASVNM